MSPLRLAAVLLPVLFLAQSAHGVRRRLASVPHRNLGWSEPNYTIYHRQDVLLREVEDIVKANPSYMKIEALKQSDKDYNAELKVLTVEPGGFSDRQADKVRMLLDFGEHGRELISSELGLLLLQTLAQPDSVLRVFPNDPKRGRELQRLLEGTLIKILPMENEGGRRLVEGGSLCERKNGRGVDPNRNWSVDWGTKEPDYDPNEEYPGTAPFSEPEVRMVRKLAADFSPHVWLNIHSGMEAMLAPWDHKAEVAVEARPAVDMLDIIHRDIMANTTCVVGSGGKSVGYLAHGTATDYMFDVLHVPIAFTWEIYGDFKAHFDDCFRMFNPLDEPGVQSVLQRWLRAIMRLVELMPAHPALRDSKAWLPSQSEGQKQGQASDGQPGSTGEGGKAQGNGLGEVHGKAAAGGGQAGSLPLIIGPDEPLGEGQDKGGAKAAVAHGAAGDAGAGAEGITDAPRLTVVASHLGWSSDWAGKLFSGLLALAGLAAVGLLAYRCLARPETDRRRGRGESHQAV